ncbi:hypothetical protein SteCoe_27709 [Stentor coeruleus]|uniref:SKP1 component dimerisation domain-containing protein n=1 Tax=Stentor coeruleus TaxID=5963 RepID=A0A1R2BA02_9CILI|nr:hypothetical protein SteCoe_27709 [Stentor coeruleus]
MSEITLVSKEGTKIQISSQFSNLSGFIHNILQDYQQNEDISLASVSFINLQMILEYAVHHNFQVPQPPRCPITSPNIADNVSDPWDAEFVNRLNEDQIIDLVTATNFLDMKSLMDLCLAKIACMFKYKDIETLRKEYGITEEFTAEIEEKLKSDFPWAMEAESND